jgi:hypothetical protein
MADTSAPASSAPAASPLTLGPVQTLDSIPTAQLLQMQQQLLQQQNAGGSSASTAATPASATPAASSAPSPLTFGPGENLQNVPTERLLQMQDYLQQQKANMSPAASVAPANMPPQSGPFGFLEQTIRGATAGLGDKAYALGSGLGHAIDNSAFGQYLDRVLPGGNAPQASPASQPAGPSQPTQGSNQPQSFTDAYHTTLNALQARDQAYGAAHPIASPVAKGLGTLVTLPLVSGLSAAGPAAEGAEAAEAVAPPIAAKTFGPGTSMLARTGKVLGGYGEAAAPATVGTRALQAAKIGAGLGAVNAFGNTNDKSLGSDVASTLGGAVVGAGAGAGGSIVADKVASPLVNWAMQRFNPAGAVSGQAVNRIAQRISQDVEADGPSAQFILKQLSEAPPGEQNTIADIGGPNVLGEAGRVVRAPGPGKTVGTEFLVNRAKQEPDTVANFVQSNISNSGSAYDATEALMKARQENAADAYKAAGIPNDPSLYPQAPVVNNPAVTRLLQKSPMVQNAINQARNFPDYADLPSNSIVMLDKAYKNIGGSAAEATRAGNGEAARDLNSLRVQLKNAITGGDPNHPYAQALDAYSGPSASLDALSKGQAILTKSPSQIKAEIGDLTQNDKEFYKLGAAQILIDRAESTGRTGNAVARIAQSVQAKNQLRPLFDNDDTFNSFVAGIDRANKRMETKTSVLGNSATAGRLAENEGGEASNPFLSGAAEATAGAMTGESIPVAGGVWNMVKGLTSNGPPRSPAVNKAIAGMLFNKDPAQQQAILQQIIAAQNRPQYSRMATVPLASLAGAHPGAALATALTPAQALARHFLGAEE